MRGQLAVIPSDQSNNMASTARFAGLMGRGNSEASRPYRKPKTADGAKRRPYPEKIEDDREFGVDRINAGRRTNL
jgi:hypothetical protein